MDSDAQIQENGESAEESTIGTNEQEHDLSVIDSKRKELDGIQKDLDDLMGRLNTFIADAHADFPSDDEVTPETEDNGTEKQDGPQEKQLRKGSLLDLIYTSDGVNPLEVNWTTAGPILQKHVEDLQRLHSLNTMTTGIVKRIRNITQINEALINLKKDEADEQP